MTANRHLYLGKISSIKFGFGGYQDLQLGVSVTLSGDGWGVSSFRGHWGTMRRHDCKWSEDERLLELGRACIWIRDMLKEAKKKTIDELVNIPVEAEFSDSGALIDWRVLKEVL